MGMDQIADSRNDEQNRADVKLAGQEEKKAGSSITCYFPNRLHDEWQIGRRLTALSVVISWRGQRVLVSSVLQPQNSYRSWWMRIVGQQQ